MKPDRYHKKSCPDESPVLAKMPAPLLPRGEMRFGGGQNTGRSTVRVCQQATLDLFTAKPAPLASRLQPLLLFAARFVERHARRGEDIAEGTLALEGREQHLAADLHERMESAVLEVMTTTLARCNPGNRDLACAAFYRPGRKENSQWGIDVTLWNAKKHGAPRRPTEVAL